MKADLIATVDVGGAPVFDLGIVSGRTAKIAPILLTQLGTSNNVYLNPSVARDLAVALVKVAEEAESRGLHGNEFEVAV